MARPKGRRLTAIPGDRTSACSPALGAFVLLWLQVGTPAMGSTSGDLSQICDQAAAEASRNTGVPLSVLRAISLTETGRKREGRVRPWPWTVNMEGKGLWFETPDEARAYVYREFKRGARSFDVGCFQINYKWHGQAFSSIDEMFDPVSNALYAARFLGELFAEKGNWSEAAGAYHSRTPEFAERYRTRFDRFQTELEGTLADDVAPDRSAPPHPEIPDIPDIVLAANGGKPDSGPRVNGFPLLKAGNAQSAGSLVPLDNQDTPHWFLTTATDLFADRPVAPEPAP